MALTPEEQAKRREVMRGIMVKSPYIASLGIVVERWDPEGVTLRLPFDPELTNDGAVHHGGAVASLMDTTGAAAVWAGHEFDKGARAATISMTINYLGAPVQTDLLADGVCV